MSRVPAYLLACLVGLCIAWAPQSSGSAPPDEDSAHEYVTEFLSTYCVKCHNDRTSKAGVTLDDLTTPSPESASRWEQVLEALATGLMPPEKQRSPSKADRSKMIGWIGSASCVRAASAFPLTDG